MSSAETRGSSLVPRSAMAVVTPGRRVTAYWDDDDGRWAGIDRRSPGEFLTGCGRGPRTGRVDAATLGVYGTDNWGPVRSAATRSGIWRRVSHVVRGHESTVSAGSGIEFNSWPS